MSVDAFKHALLKVSNQLTQPQLKEMLFLCPFIGRGRKEKITKGYELFEVLTERKKIQPDDTAFLSHLLTEVGRHDLCDQLSPTGNCGSAGSPDDPNDAEGGVCMYVCVCMCVRVCVCVYSHVVLHRTESEAHFCF